MVSAYKSSSYNVEDPKIDENRITPPLWVTIPDPKFDAICVRTHTRFLI